MKCSETTRNRLTAIARFPPLAAPHAEATPMTLLPALQIDSLHVVPWPDDVIDALGHDPRSNYAEMFWLGTLGPSTTWLLRRMVAGLDSQPDGYELSLSETATCLGLGNKGGRHSPF